VADRLDLRRLEPPIVQAGMGAVARHELAAAVSEAGGLGTIAGARAPIERELRAARALTGRPVAVNLLLPFLRPGDVEAAAQADLIVTFWGPPRRPAGCAWAHQCGSVAEAVAAEAAGADAIIAQGVEAGGHVRGQLASLELLEQVLAAVRIPVLSAGGIVDREGVSDALAAGAAAAVVGTRFLLSVECRAHAEYKRRCLAADRTVLTELFGMGWPQAPHRVIPNAATERWLGDGGDPPSWVTALNRALAPVVGRMPDSLTARALAAQRASRPLLSPQPPTDDGPVNLVDSGPLYAGTAVARINDVRPAAQLVADLTP
jgi:NAD(P)H-dependent flavin oxidoreductase YrpB (nitropropane dioxygenase family)